MIDRRRAFRLVLAALGAASLAPAARAQQSFERFIPLLIDLPGWEGPPPAGTVEERAGGSVITAARGYSRGEARFYASVMSGISLAASESSTNFTFFGACENASTIDGFQIMTLRTAVFVSISVTLGPDAKFGLLFNNVSPDEAMMLARKFDWKAMQALIN